MAHGLQSLPCDYIHISALPVIYSLTACESELLTSRLKLAEITFMCLSSDSLCAPWFTNFSVYANRPVCHYSVKWLIQRYTGGYGLFVVVTVVGHPMNTIL